MVCTNADLNILFFGNISWHVSDKKFFIIGDWEIAGRNIFMPVWNGLAQSEYKHYFAGIL